MFGAATLTFLTCHFLSMHIASGPGGCLTYSISNPHGLETTPNFRDQRAEAQRSYLSEPWPHNQEMREPGSASQERGVQTLGSSHCLANQECYKMLYCLSKV